MKILFYPVQNNQRYNSSVSFQMKKSELGAFNKFVYENCFTEKPNLQTFKVIQEFYNSCKDVIGKIIPKDFNFGGRQQETIAQRKAMLEEWYNYVTTDNSAYNAAIQLMILRAITKNLKPNEDSLPPVLNKGVLAGTVNQVVNQMKDENKDDKKADKKIDFNFEKEYRLNLQKSIFSEEKVLDENLNGWIIIPSEEHDPEHFSENVDKLKTLSHRNWCTASFDAEPYLTDGDFHVYMEKGKPKLGVRFVGDEIQEIQGEKNDSKIPVKYGDIVLTHIKDYKLTNDAKKEIEILEKTKQEIENIRLKFPNGIENATTRKILRALVINYKKNDDGLLTISHYGNSSKDYTYSDIGIDENKLFKDIKVIEGDADFRGSQLTSLGNLKSIGGRADFENSQITSLGNLKSIFWNAYFQDSQITSLGELESIGGNAYFKNSKITSLGNLKSIGGGADFENSQITDLGKLKSIGESANFENSQITGLGELESIGGNAYFKNSKITSLGNLKSIGRSADFENSQITSLGNLKSIGGSANFENSQITSLGELESIGGNAYFENSKITSLGNLKSIGGSADFKNSQITSLGNLKSIFWNAYFEDSQITSLGELESIGAHAHFENSQIESLGKLKLIGGNTYIRGSKLKSGDFAKVKIEGKIRS